MTPLDDHSQQRRQIFFPVVIATVLLTIISMIGGYLLSERRRTLPKPTSTSTTSVSTSTSTTASAESSSTSVGLPTDGPCPAHTQDEAKAAGADGEVSKVFKVVTDKSVVWICQDEAGRLFYHGNKGGEGAEWVEGVTALFLTDVEKSPDGGFRAVANSDNTVFLVNREQLVIRKSSGKDEVQKVVGN
ncbi:hypothetical protein [Actinoplanes regularis]|uniref:hypothetical protein n=1 Tax=Actinoplanes regularis TaxID=52697 RepID=UPI002557C703|nr:hypothetical protein [Actinoplanes regularis]